jgi:hypothetical protein
MIQARCNTPKMKGEWTDLVTVRQIDLIQAKILEWRDDGLSEYEIWFEYRNKPNIFTRIKEWWNNE